MPTGVLLPIAPDKWRSLGCVTFPKSKPLFPEDPTNPSKAKVPGIYRLTFDNGYIYIGQTGRLRGRFGVRTRGLMIYGTQIVRER